MKLFSGDEEAVNKYVVSSLLLEYNFITHALETDTGLDH